MRYFAIVGVGLGIITLGACGGGDEGALGARGNNTAGFGAAGFSGTTCAADVDCHGGEICAQGVCVSARGNTGGSAPGSTGGTVGFGGAIGLGGIPIGLGGIPIGLGGIPIGQGGIP